MNPSAAPEYEARPRTLRNLKIVAAAGGALFLVGLLADHRRAWTGYLLGFGLLTGLGLAGAFFVSIAYLANAHWAVALRRIPEAMAGTLPLAAAVGIGLLSGIPSLYPWAHPHDGGTLDHKLAWLHPAAFSIRLILAFALWIWLAFRLLRASRAQDADRDRRWSVRNLWNAVHFVVVFAITFSVVSVDWFQSLEPEWFSTMYALQALAGLALAGIALLMVAAVTLRDHGPLRGVLRDDHLDDLGKLALALSLFWVYTGFCQYMLIWYTDLPEETGWYAVRNAGTWGTLNLVSVALNWLVPFCILMPKRARRSGAIVLRVGCLLLLGRILDLYILLGPPLMPDGPHLGIWELAPVAGVAALFAWGFLRALARVPLLPAGDPHLAKSLAHHC